MWVQVQVPFRAFATNFCYLEHPITAWWVLRHPRVNSKVVPKGVHWLPKGKIYFWVEEIQLLLNVNWGFKVRLTVKAEHDLLRTW